jgi:threonine/homoserine/homoserine lactone efflux protein
LFYLGFLPTFVDHATLRGVDIVVIASVVTIVLGLTMLAYAYAASKARTLFQNPTSQRWMSRSAGCAMITTGSVLAAKT